MLAKAIPITAIVRTVSGDTSVLSFQDPSPRYVTVVVDLEEIDGYSRFSGSFQVSADEAPQVGDLISVSIVPVITKVPDDERKHRT